MRAAYTITIPVVLAVVACSDGREELFAKRREAVLDERRPRAPAPEVTSVDTVVSPNPLRDKTEGASSPEAVFARAQRAVASGDALELLLSVRPATRARWLRDLVVAMAVVSSDDGTDHDPISKRAKLRIRELLRRYGASGSVSDPSDLSAEGVGRVLVEKVKDPDGLYAALLTFAAENRAEYDPVRALERLPRGARVSERPDPTASSLLRLVDRVRAPHEIGPVDADAGSQALTRAPDAGPAGDAFFPVRFYTEGGVTWLDES
ncbi:MAG: hypothetical protein U0414_43935 [Polyangiaceae bacterium]